MTIRIDAPPGDPEVLGRYIADLQDARSGAQSSASEARGISTSAGTLAWEGDAAEAFDRGSAQLTEQLEGLVVALSKAADVVEGYARRQRVVHGEYEETARSALLADERVEVLDERIGEIQRGISDAEGRLAAARQVESVVGIVPVVGGVAGNAVEEVEAGLSRGVALLAQVRGERSSVKRQRSRLIEELQALRADLERAGREAADVILALPIIGADDRLGATAAAAAAKVQAAVSGIFTRDDYADEIGEDLSLAEILTDYQVVDDELVMWEPSGLVGFFGELATDIEPRQITKTEAELLDTFGLLPLKRFEEIHDKAFADSTEYYPGETDRERNDGHQDAHRHAYWNALMTKEYGADFASRYGTAHEGLPGNYASMEAMDLYNNEVGRQIATDNPDASDEELAKLVYEAVERGDTVVVGTGGTHLEFSDDVAFGEHGEAERSAAEGRIRPDGAHSYEENPATS